MKVIFAIVLALAVVTTSASLQSLLKSENLIAAGFPEQFAWEADTFSPTGVNATGIFRVDGKNNLASYTLNYLDTAFGVFTNLTYAWNYNTSTFYLHTTGDDFCDDYEFENPVVANQTIDSFISQVWEKTAVVVREEEVDGVKQTLINLNYDEEDEIDILVAGDQIARVNGTFLDADFYNEVTKPIYLANFTVDSHIPQACN